MNENEMNASVVDSETYTTDLAQQAQQEIIALKKQVEDLKKEVTYLKLAKYTTPDYQYIYEERLNPPSYNPSLEEIKLASARYAFDNEIFHIFHYIKMYIDSLEGKQLQFPYTKEIVEENAKNALKKWDKSLEKWDDDNDVWDCFVNPEWFNTVYVNGLSDYHSGNCTAFACSCSRCDAEDIFKIENTVTWGKAEGSKMEYAFMNDFKQKKIQDNNT